MRVLFDLQAFADQRRGGVPRYFIELGHSLQERSRWMPLLSPGLHCSADTGLSSLPGGPLIRAPERGIRLKRRINQAINALSSSRLGGLVDVIHPTWYHRPTIEAFGDKPFVITIHDMIPEMLPEVTTPEEVAHRAWAIKDAGAILCVSEATKQDLLDRFPEVSERTFAVHPGMTPLPAPGTKRGSPDPYFVFVGKRGSYKDFGTLVEALGIVRQPLYAVGGGPPEEAILNAIDARGMNGLVRFLSNPTDGELADLLAGAVALVSTSRIEGFGLPPLEALALGTPVVLSDIAVYREVYGAWGTFFTPGEPEDLADKMNQVLAGRFAVPRLEELSSKFSWSAAAAIAETAYDISLNTSGPSTRVRLKP